MPPPPGSRFGAEQRILLVGSTRVVLTKMSTAGLMVMVTMSLTAGKRLHANPSSDNPGAGRKQNRPRERGRFELIADDQLPSMVLITLDIGRAVSSPPPISLSTISLYSGSGSMDVLLVTCTTL